MQNKIPETLFHYCKFENFKKIIRSKSIWLSNNKFTNDTLENKIILKHLPAIKKFFIDNQAKEIAELLDEKYENGELKNFTFSLSGDDGNRLSQWRGYGDDLKGISIGFNKPNLEKHIQDISKGSFPTIVLDKVLYDNKTQNEFLQNECEKALREWIIDDDKERRFWMVSIIFLNLLRRYDATLKDNFFYEEKEYRVIHLSLDIRDHSHHSILSELKEYEKDNGDIIDYKSLDFNNEIFESLIDKVIIGPLNKSSEDQVISLLKEQNLNNIAVEKIASSYRPC